jgi:hypothetical protein
VRRLPGPACDGLSDGGNFLLSAEPDIHLMSETPKSPHRRLSLCSLTVPKQTEGSLGSFRIKLRACQGDDTVTVS